MKVTFDGRPLDVPNPVIVVELLAAAGLDGTYQVFEECDGGQPDRHLARWNERILLTGAERFYAVPPTTGG